MKEVTKNIISAFKTSSIRVKLVVSVAAAVLLTTTVCEAADIKFAYKITYNNEAVGYVASKEQLSDLETEVLDSIKADDAKSYMRDATATLSLTVGNRISTSSSLATNILKSDVRLCGATAVTVNGEVLCAVQNSSKQGIEDALLARLNAYNNDENCKAEFVDNVKVETGYFPRSVISPLESAEEKLSEINVKTVSTVKYTEDIPFETVTTKSSKYLSGYKKVTKAGVTGKKDITAVLTLVNGNETARDVIESVVVSEPVAQKVTVGTAVKSTSSGKKVFKWPLKKVAGQVITSYYGDGRNHRAIDIASPKGTPVLAALGGTVSFAGYAKDYGYYVIIDHGNGYQTLYSHESELYVEKGQVVTTGQVIGAVGATGRATGNHLHYEVRINGNRVNPLNYTNR